MKRSRSPHGKQGRHSEPVNAAGHIKVEHDRESVGPPSSSARESVRKDRILATEFLTRQRSDVALLEGTSLTLAVLARAHKTFGALRSDPIPTTVYRLGDRGPLCAATIPAGAASKLEGSGAASSGPLAERARTAPSQKKLRATNERKNVRKAKRRSVAPTLARSRVPVPSLRTAEQEGMETEHAQIAEERTA